MTLQPEQHRVWPAQQRTVVAILTWVAALPSREYVGEFASWPVDTGQPVRWFSKRPRPHGSGAAPIPRREARKDPRYRWRTKGEDVTLRFLRSRGLPHPGQCVTCSA